jgi:hypothetical protein
MILPDSPYTVLVEYLVVLWDGQSPHPATIVEVMILVGADQKHNKAMTQELAEKQKQENTTKLILLTSVEVCKLPLTAYIQINCLHRNGSPAQCIVTHGSAETQILVMI